MQGDAYRLARRWAEALAVYREALAIFQVSFIRRHRGICLYKLGLTYQGMGENERAVSFYAESQAIFKELRLEAYVGLIRDAMATCEHPDH